MKSKLLPAIMMPVALTFATASFAQTAPPSPAEPAPAEKMETAPAPTTPAPSAATPAPSSSDSAAVESSAGTFTSAQAADEWRSSKLIGLTVYNKANEKIGDVNDLILGPDGKVASAVIGVGGFLGMGEKLVAVPFSDLQLNRDADGTMRVTTNSTKEALENAPDFKYYSPKAE
jgi:sporulation protein YlmC with PRC-barrel domain